MFLPLLLFFMQCVVAFASDATNVDQYLAAHNVVREANRVPPLQWSEELAQVAQDWANTCQFTHSNGTLSAAPYGENIVAATGTFPISTALSLFSKDAGKYNRASPEFSDWTQVVWRSTEHMGCAYSHCDGIFPPVHGLAIMYICLYQPPGNVVHQESTNVPV